MNECICILPVNQSVHNVAKVLSQEDKYGNHTYDKYLFRDNYSYVLSSLFCDVFSNSNDCMILLLNTYCDFKFKDHGYPQNDMSGEKAATYNELKNIIIEDYKMAIEFYNSYKFGLMDYEIPLSSGDFVMEKVGLNLIVIRLLV